MWSPFMQRDVSSEQLRRLHLFLQTTILYKRFTSFPNKRVRQSARSQQASGKKHVKESWPNIYLKWNNSWTRKFAVSPPFFQQRNNTNSIKHRTTHASDSIAVWVLAIGSPSVFFFFIFFYYTFWLFIYLFVIQWPVGLNGNRKVEGTLRGYDQFMNVVLDDCVEAKNGGERRPIGMSVIRGNSILTMETLPGQHNRQ